ncbi:MAG: tetratricopeptide (TPR) repeat protein [Desulforhopalus sp.]|jgi:tetratricopeptide (TPR) repeat protein
MYLKRLCHILILLLLTGFAVTVQAGDVESRFEAGNAAYSLGEYDKAIDIYSEILAQEGNGSGLLYNLANSYAQKGEVGLAILNYERALKLTPSDPNILGNLAKVRKDKGLFIEEPGKVGRFFSTLSLDGWTLLAFGCLLYLLMFLILRLKYKSFPRSFSLSGACAALLLILSIFGAAYSYQTYNPLVVVAKDVKLQISPFEGAASTGAVEEGRLLFPVKQHGDYWYAADRSGRKGWLKMDVVERIYSLP